MKLYFQGVTKLLRGELQPFYHCCLLLGWHIRDLKLRSKIDQTVFLGGKPMVCGSFWDIPTCCQGHWAGNRANRGRGVTCHFWINPSKSSKLANINPGSITPGNSWGSARKIVNCYACNPLSPVWPYFDQLEVEQNPWLAPRNPHPFSISPVFLRLGGWARPSGGSSDLRGRRQRHRGRGHGRRGVSAAAPSGAGAAHQVGTVVDDACRLGAFLHYIFIGF